MQIVQETNMGLIDIRANELEYFSFFFSGFGTNSLLMAGFMAGSLSQQNCGFDSDPGAPYASVVFYWLSCALCAATGIFTLCGAQIIQIFGQNLAINGPEGSMIVALEGMLQEQKVIVFGSLATAFFFICQMVGMLWFRADQLSAICCSCVCGFAMFVTYHWLLRIYNRFNWSKKLEMNWDRTISSDLSNLRPSLVEDISSWVMGRPSMTEHTPTIDNDRATVVGVSMKPVISESSQFHKQYRIGVRNLLLGGLLTMRSRNRIGRTVWKRRYVILKDNYIFFYRSRREFSLNPTKPMNKRPIDLEGYTLVGGAAKPPYAISLAPIDPEDFRKIWKFRCDTLAEFNRWIEALMTAISISNEGQDMTQFIKISPDDGAPDAVSNNADMPRGQQEDDDEDDD